MKTFKTKKEITSFDTEEKGLVNGFLTVKIYNAKKYPNNGESTAVTEYFIFIPSEIELDDSEKELFEGVEMGETLFVKKNHIRLSREETIGLNNLESIIDYASSKLLKTAWGLTSSDWEEII